MFSRTDVLPLPPFFRPVPSSCHNCQVFDQELPELEEVIRHLATAGVDALIVQVGAEGGGEAV